MRTMKSNVNGNHSSLLIEALDWWQLHLLGLKLKTLGLRSPSTRRQRNDSCGVTVTTL